jgi:hypothetical protein
MKPRVRVKANSAPTNVLRVVFDASRLEAEPDVVSTLEDVLVQARAGKIVSVAIALVQSKGDIETVFVDGQGRFKLIAATAHLTQRLLAT